MNTNIADGIDEETAAEIIYIILFDGNLGGDDE